MGKPGSVVKAENAAREAKRKAEAEAQARAKAEQREARALAAKGLGPLTPREEAFCAEYVKDWNATAAAVRAGVPKRSAASQSSRMLDRQRVQDRIQHLRELAGQSERAAVMSAQEVLEALSRIARADIRKLFNARGALVDLQALDDETALAVAGVESDDIFEGRGEEREHVGFTRKVKLNDRIAALTRLGEHHQLFKKEDDKARLPSVTFNFVIGGR